MVPPVALLAYSPAPEDGDRKAAFWPFAEFSPEWQAIRYGLGADAPVRFCDLPTANQLVPSGEEPPEEGIRLDPLGWLAKAADYDDAERWWDDVVEHREGGPSPFPAIAEAMASCARNSGGVSRAPRGAARGPHAPDAAPHAQGRPRAGRGGLRRLARARPAAKVPATHDDRTLRGLPKTKVAMTWVPWTHGRLAGHSGYGAGVRSPAGTTTCSRPATVRSSAG